MFSKRTPQHKFPVHSAKIPIFCEVLYLAKSVFYEVLYPVEFVFCEVPYPMEFVFCEVPYPTELVFYKVLSRSIPRLFLRGSDFLWEYAKVRCLLGRPIFRGILAKSGLCRRPDDFLTL